MLFQLATKSLWNRRGSVLLTLLAVWISLSLLIASEHARSEIRNSFTRTISGVDLIVGARTGSLNLLLYSVFRIGNATNGVSWDTVNRLQDNPKVNWVIPISLGDAHHGFRVVGTTNAYFEKFKYGSKRPLSLIKGQKFTSNYSAVLGADAAQALGYNVGEELVVSHGINEVSFQQHDSHPFTVTGILEKTGTPVDQAIYVTLVGIDSIHATPHKRVVKKPQQHEPHLDHNKHHQHHTSATPHSDVTAVLLGLTSRVAALQMQYQLNQSDIEPLTAILPGLALAELWQLMGNMEAFLQAIVVIIVVSALLGLATMLLATMRERQQEIAIFRALGARSWFILLLIQAEALVISAAALLAALVTNVLFFIFAADWLSTQYGLIVSPDIFSKHILIICGLIICTTLLVALVPAIAAYQKALHSGLAR